MKGGEEQSVGEGKFRPTAIFEKLALEMKKKMRDLQKEADELAKN